MNYKRIIAGLFTIGMITALLAFSRDGDDPLVKIMAQLDKWVSAHPQEKVYLQLDRPCYAIGDDIWFKAYVTIGSEHKLSALSGVLYVELINDKDSVKQSLKLPVTSGLTWGDFTLPDTLKEGNYRVRAYTNWMRNAGSDYFFDQHITVTNAITNNVFTHTTYTYSTQNGKQQVSAVINYADLNGVGYANKPVNYKIELGAVTVAKGNEQTDDKGNLNLDFVNPSPRTLMSGRIVTGLKLAEKIPIEKSILVKAASSNTDVQFFPEGGNLVNGNNTKIAFKATGADGIGTDIRGVVMDDQGNKITTFSSSHLGMGVFEMNPENARTYKARITYADGSESVSDLPTATNGGYSLNIDNTAPDVIHIKILPGSVISASSDAGEVMCLVAQSGGQVYYAGKSKPGSKFFTADIPKSKFPSGIVQFTLFSSTGEPMNERLIFIQHHDQLKLEANTRQQVYSPREKVKISLNAKDKDGQPVIGAFSAAVIDESKVPFDADSENSIISNLLLTSDIKGYVEKPGYYFNNENDKTAANLDILMLTQGYRRFDWKQVLTDTYPPDIYQPEKTLTISGHLKNLLGKPVVNGKVILFTSKGGLFMIDTVSDSKGNFSFKNLLFRDSVRFIIQARTARNGKNIQVDIDDVQPAAAAGNKNWPDFSVNFDNGLSSFLQNSKTQYDNEIKYGIIDHSIRLKEVVIKDKREEPLKNSSNLNGPGNADQVIKASDNVFSGCGDITDCLRSAIHGVIFKNDTPYLASSQARPMQIVLDGSYVDASVLSDINPDNVQSVEVLRNIEYTGIYGGRGNYGILVITSKSGGQDATYQRYAPGVINYMPRGYTKVREFYSPQYDNPKTNAQIPDLRSTIYWKPNLVTGKDGKASIEFFNADGKGTYRVVIEGMDSEGHLGRLVYRYKVE